jgi:pimeloyl-ACP methyl ester carboxylesterase
MKNNATLIPGTLSKLMNSMRAMRAILSIALILGLTGCYSQDFVTIDGNRIHYEIKGSGEPWIVLINGSGLDMNSLDTIFGDLSNETTVLRYSRAGLGESTFTNMKKDFNTMVNELHTLVKELEVPEPFILGGHSFGGLIIKAFAVKYPSKVAGLLSMDPAFEDNWAVLEQFEPGLRDKYVTPLKYVKENFPDHGGTHEFETVINFYDSPESWKAGFDYPGTIPHFVITSLQTTDAPNGPGRGSEEIMNARAEAQYRAIAYSDIHMQIRVSDAGHLIYNDQPQLVIDAFKMLLNLTQ